MTKEERKGRKILTQNRLTTINKRETSYEGLAANFENGEDSIYNLQSTNSKNNLLSPKISITQKDLAQIPELAKLHEAIITLQKNYLPYLSGKDLYILKKFIIALQKDQYIIKDLFRLPVQSPMSFHGKTPIHLDGEIYLNSQNDIVTSGITLANPKIVYEVLNNYARLKEDRWDDFDSDTFYFMKDFDSISDAALKPYPIF